MAWTCNLCLWCDFKLGFIISFTKMGLVLPQVMLLLGTLIKMPMGSSPLLALLMHH